MFYIESFALRLLFCISFKATGMEYDYDIDATAGAILQAKSEVDD